MDEMYILNFTSSNDPSDPEIWVVEKGYAKENKRKAAAVAPTCSSSSYFWEQTITKHGGIPIDPF